MNSDFLELPIPPYHFDTLVIELNKRVEMGLITTQFHKEYPTLQLFTYSDKCVWEQAWDEYTEMARGLIICNSEKRIVARPFKKFHNYGNKFAYTPKENESFEVFEKYDGSLIIIFSYRDQWLTATKGSFHSEQAVWAKNWIEKNKEKLSPFSSSSWLKSDCRHFYTYLAEAIYPQNRIVVDYNGKEDLVLLSIIEPQTGDEIPISSSFGYGWTLAKTYTTLNFEELLKHTKNLSSNEEGYVVRYASGNRIKIKGDEYCILHRTISKITPLSIWEHYLNMDDLEEIKKGIPDEFVNEFLKISFLLSKSFCENLSYLLNETEKYGKFSDKELGLHLNSINTPIIKTFIFSVRKGTFISSLYKKDNVVRRKFFEFFKPKGNILEGYKSNFSMVRKEE